MNIRHQILRLDLFREDPSFLQNSWFKKRCNAVGVESTKHVGLSVGFGTVSAAGAPLIYCSQRRVSWTSRVKILESESHNFCHSFFYYTGLLTVRSTYYDYKFHIIHSDSEPIQPIGN